MPLPETSIFAASPNPPASSSITFMPAWGLKVFEQKLDYIQNNPLEGGFVMNAVDSKYSNARNYGANVQTVLENELN